MFLVQNTPADQLKMATAGILVDFKLETFPGFIRTLKARCYRMYRLITYFPDYSEKNNRKHIDVYNNGGKILI